MLKFLSRKHFLSFCLILIVSILPHLSNAKTKVIHVNVALCDNFHQKIYPVPLKLGNGSDPENNLYWGAMYGIKTFFKNSPDWIFIKEDKNVSDKILRRAIFKHKSSDSWMVADAYEGKYIKDSIEDFLAYSAGKSEQKLTVSYKEKITPLGIGGNSDLVVFVGHNGLMDFSLGNIPQSEKNQKKDAIILACYSKAYFSEILKETGANPLLLTNGKMAPEGYVLSAALNSWILGNEKDKIQQDAGLAYAKYQKISKKAGVNLFKN